MLGEYHDEALEDDEEQVLLVGLRRLQQILQLLNLHHTHMHEFYSGLLDPLFEKLWICIHCFIIIQNLSGSSEDKIKGFGRRTEDVTE